MTFEIILRREADSLYTYTKLLSPQEVAGTQIVLVDHPTGDDLQLLYLPALKKVNRITDRAKDRPFMGSDLHFSDLDFSMKEASNHKILEESSEKWVVESEFTDHPHYSKWITTIDRRLLLPTEVIYFDRRGKRLKILTVDQHSAREGQVFPMQTTIQNLQKNTKTVLTVEDLSADLTKEEVPLNMFSEEYLMEQK